MLAFPTPVLLFQEKTRGWQLGGSSPTGPFPLPLSNELQSDSKNDIPGTSTPPLWSLYHALTKKTQGQAGCATSICWAVKARGCPFPAQSLAPRSLGCPNRGTGTWEYTLPVSRASSTAPSYTLVCRLKTFVFPLLQIISSSPWSFRLLRNYSLYESR